jgi:hypothetical protein
MLHMFESLCFIDAATTKTAQTIYGISIAFQRFTAGMPR